MKVLVVEDDDAVRSAIRRALILKGYEVVVAPNGQAGLLEADMAVVSMDALGVAVSTRSACNIGSDEPSHVIKALGVPQKLAGTAIRITLLPDATKGDARRIAAALFETAERYKTG